MTRFPLKLAENDDVGETDLRVINARKKGIFCRTESVAVTPKSRDHMPTTSHCKMANSSSEDETDTLPERPTRIQPYQFESVRQDFESVPEHRVSFEVNPMRYSMGFAKSQLTEVLATQMGVMRRSKKVSSFELYKPNPLSSHCGSIAREFMHCYTWGRLRFVTVRGNTVGRHS